MGQNKQNLMVKAGKRLAAVPSVEAKFKRKNI